MTGPGTLARSQPAKPRPPKADLSQTRREPPHEREDRELRPLYTRTGDDGSTGLFFGGRVAKDDPRIEACGAIDEVVAAMGVARSLRPAAEGLEELLLRIQRELFVLGAELAAAEQNSAKLKPEISRVTDGMVAALELQIDRMTGIYPPPAYFVIPGETETSAALDTARVIARRAERRVVTLSTTGSHGYDCCLRYLNRLSDLLFAAARLEEHSRGLSAPRSRDSSAD